jgi:hypothetical protein
MALLLLVLSLFWGLIGESSFCYADQLSESESLDSRRLQSSLKFFDFDYNRKTESSLKRNEGDQNRRLLDTDIPVLPLGLKNQSKEEAKYLKLHKCRDAGEVYGASYLITREHLTYQFTGEASICCDI